MATASQQDEDITETFYDASQDPYEDSEVTTDVIPNKNSNENNWHKNGFGQGLKTRTGKYTKEETEIIKNAVKEYCTMKQISVSRLCSECDHKADLKGSWMEIAKCLPYRSVQSVYRHGLRQLHPFKRGAWSDREVEQLIGFVATLGKKWAHIQAKLNRSADSCRDKYRELDSSYVRGRWQEEETEQLKRLIRESLNVDPKMDMLALGKMVEAEQITIAWSAISKRMGKRSRLSCFKKWQKMTGLFSPCDVGRFKLRSDDGRAKEVASGRSKQNSAQAKSEVDESSVSIVDETVDVDVYLLTELISMDYSKASDVSWDEFRIDDAENRWYELVEEWQSNMTDDSLLALPLSEIAQLIMDRKTSAQRAAETVEAVDLPGFSSTVQL
ncbi:unnamed protein product [Pseudo-nitzschia multistriata]|uniref:Myb-like domain-containing protein n=1 Tax=Pseudo-nitzschia multistriata TaxID=183589 RepID=A0A448YUR4_9STRA|nr:unnamed protein product [Pseudo-nitzschia multistriata]